MVFLRPFSSPSSRAILGGASLLLLLPCLGWAQEVRRAQAVGSEPPTAPAVPFEPFVKPSPSPRPALRNTQPTITDETGPRIVPAAPAAHVSASSADQVQLAYADDLYARGLVDAAAPEYEKYLGLYPHAAPADRQQTLFRLGECYRKLGNVNSAKNAYQTLLLNFATGQFIGPAAYRLADLYYQEKDYDSALDYYRKASVRLADPAAALAAKYYSARSLEMLSLPSEARLTYEDIVSTKGDNPYREPSRLALAEILKTGGRKEDALRQFDLLAQEAEQPVVKAEAYVKAGLLNIDLGHTDKGAADLNQALKIPEIGQWLPVAQLGLLRVLYDSGKYHELLAQYQKAYDSMPADAKPEILLLAANSKRQLNDAAGSGALYTRVVTEYPNSTYAQEAKYQRLVSLYNADDSGVVAAVDQFLADNPDPTKKDQAMLLKAEALFKDQRYADAAPVYAALQDSLLSSSYRAEALFKLGWCYMQTKDPEKAITALTSFLEGFPTNKLIPSALVQRAVAHQEMKDLTGALKDFNRLLDDYPHAKERELALQQKALIQGEQQDNAGMAQTFRQLLQEFPHTPAAAQANYWIGWAAYAAKDYKASIVPLETARKLDKAQFFERSTLRIIAAHYTLEDRDPLAAEVDLYNGSNPKDKVPADVLRWLGSAYLSSKNFTRSTRYLAQLTSRPEATAADWLSLGNAQLGAKQYPEAVVSLNKSLAGESDPRAKATTLLALSQAQIGLKQLDEAQASADKACLLQPEGALNAQGRLLSGDIQVARGNLDAASKVYLSISLIIDDPAITPVALEKAYDCLLKAGDAPGAAKVLNDLKTKYPEYPIKPHKIDGL